MYDLGIIGVGNMGGAILKGVLNSEIFEPSKIIIYEKNIEKTMYFSDLGVGVADSEQDVAKYSKILLLAVKPTMLESIGRLTKDYIARDTFILSIAAGVSIADLKTYFGGDKLFVRAMPNTPALINEGMTAVVPDSNIHMDDIRKIIEIFESVGRVAVMNEEKIAVFTGSASSMPAYIYMFIEAAAEASVRHGFNRMEAYEYISQAVMGAAKMVLETGKHPGELKDQVTSPKGSTIRGVMALEREGFRNAVITAVDEGIEASKKLI